MRIPPHGSLLFDEDTPGGRRLAGPRIEGNGIKDRGARRLLALRTECPLLVTLQYARPALRAHAACERPGTAVF